MRGLEELADGVERRVAGGDDVQHGLEKRGAAMKGAPIGGLQVHDLAALQERASALRAASQHERDESHWRF